MHSHESRAPFIVICVKSRGPAEVRRGSLDLYDVRTQDIVVQLGTLDEIFHFEIFKNFMEVLKYFKTTSLKYFMKFLIFIIK